VLNPAHEQDTIELHRSPRKGLPVVKKARFHLLDRERLHLPGEGAQLQAVEFTRRSGDRVAERAAFEEIRRCRKRTEARGGGQLGGEPAVDEQVGLAVIAVQSNVVTFGALAHQEAGMMVHSWKEPAADQSIEARG